MKKPQKPGTSLAIEPDSILLISYVPLLMDEPGRQIPLKDRKQLETLLELTTSGRGRVDCCVWATGDAPGFDDPYPILLLPRAKEVAEHFKAWASGTPAAWFKLHLYQAPDSGRYGLALIPDLDMYINRYKFTRLMLGHDPIPKGTKFTILFSAIEFVSQVSHTYDKIKGKLGNKLKVCLAETEAIDNVKAGLPIEDQIELGTFEVVRESSEYLAHSVGQATG